MSFSRKTWVKRLSEYPNRRKLTNVSTSEQALYIVERDEGIVTQEGDGFTRNNMNDLEQRISDAFNDEHTYLTALLPAGETSVTFVSEAITEGCRVHVFVPLDKCKLIYDEIRMPSEGTLVVVFPAQTTDTVIEVKVDNMNFEGDTVDNKPY